MKRLKGSLICTLLPVLLCILIWPALSEAAAGEYVSISELKEEAKEGWHETYQAYGRTIVVDIPVQVPETDAFPAIKAVPMPALDSMPITNDRGYNQGNDKFFNEAGFFRWDSPSGEVKTEASRKYKKDPPRGMDVTAIVRYFNQLEWDTAYAYNNSSTVRDADTLMKDIWVGYFPGEECTLIPHWVYAYREMRRYDSKTDTFTGEPWPEFQGPLMVYFDQVIRGIPLLCYPSDSFTKYAGSKSQENRGRVGGTAIIQGMKDIGLEGMSLSMQYSLLKEQQEIAQDLPLCSLDKAIGAYEQLIAEGKLRSVQSLRLGYVAWFNKGEPESYTLLPTWVLEGELLRKADEEQKRPTAQFSPISGEYGPILVNAQTGELIDPWNDSPDRSFDKPHILPWE